MEQDKPKAEEPYAPEELANAIALVNCLKEIRQRLIHEGIPIEEYERLLIRDDEGV